MARLDSLWSARLPDFVVALAWLPSGRGLIALEGSGGVVHVDAEKGANRRIGEHALGASSVSVRHDGAVVATGGQDCSVALWDTASWSELRRLPMGRQWVEHVAFQSRGPLLAVASGKRVWVLDERGDTVHDLGEHASTVTAIGWSPNGKQLAVAIYGGIALHVFARDGSVSSTMLPWQGAPMNVAWSPDAKTLVAGFQDGHVHFWRVASGANSRMAGYETKVRCTAWSATGRHLATAGGQNVVVWDFGGRGPEGTRPLQLTGHTDRVTALVYQPQGGHLASAGRDWRLSLWRPAATEKMLDAHLLDAPASALAWSPDSARLCAATESGELTLYKLG